MLEAGLGDIIQLISIYLISVHLRHHAVHDNKLGFFQGNNKKSSGGGQFSSE